MTPLFLYKLGGVLWITLMSALGVFTPFVFLSRCSGDSSHRSLCISAFAHVSWLSLMNCFSAGMLLTLALAHFLPSAFSDDPSLSVEHICSYALVGVLFPLILELVLGGEGSHSHSHSHGSHHEDDPDAPATSRRAVSTTVILIVLMCFHGVMEGLLLGLEKHTEILFKVAFPLSVHKFFDGVVIGVSVAKERAKLLREAESTTTEVESPDDVDEKKSFKVVGVMRNMSYYVLGWLAVTPVTMLGVIIYNALSASQLAKGDAKSHQAPSSSRSFVFAFVQSAGAGSFIYVSLSILFQERAKGVLPCAAVIMGVLFTFLLFNFPENHL